MGHNFGTREDKRAIIEELFFRGDRESGESLQDLKESDMKDFTEQLTSRQLSPGETVLSAGDTETEPKLTLFRSGGCDIFAVVFDDGKPASSTRRSDVSFRKKKNSKEKRIAKLKSPFFVGEGWMLTGASPTATVKTNGKAECYELTATSMRQLTANGNITMHLVARDLKVTAYERTFIHDFYNSLFKHNIEDQKLMRAFLEYGNDKYCAENFEFCLAVHDMKVQAERVENWDDAVNLTQPIWDKFIEPEILNISGKVHKALVQAKDDAYAMKNTAALCTVYDDAALLIHKTIQQTLTPDFMKSKRYADFLSERFPMPPPKDGASKSRACLIS